MEEYREQPFMEPANASGEAVENSAVSEEGSLNNLTDESLTQGVDKEESPMPAENYGKFKSLQALVDAYNSLQASFTQKCQRLSQLEKDKTSEKPTENQLDIEQGLNEFLSKNAEAKNYADEIKSQVLSQGETSTNVFENAWNKVILNHVKSASKAKDELVDKYVLSDENVRNKIIEDYINSLNNAQAPIVITSGQGQRVAEAVSSSPTTLSDAKKAMERMFQ